MSNSTADLQDLVKSKKSLLIAFGCGSQLAEKVLPGIQAFNSYVLISSKPGELEIDGTAQKFSVFEDLSVESLDGILERCELPRRSELSEIVIISFTGVADEQIFCNLSSHEIDRIIDINLKSNIYLTSVVLKRYGVGVTSFIFLSSTRALLGDRGITMYSATKHALNGFVKGIALEYGRFGVSANVLSLGVLPVGLINKVPKKRIDDMVKRSANRKMVGIDSVIKSLDFLRHTRDVNGTIFNCDGGYF
jgi:NAD(P)-dependent dehydrogenase (short-subunit alcohol dehydrogenase family)